jgi:predicted ArsR family transcriptional regulator
MPDDLSARAASVGALAEPARRALYQYVAGQPGPVSREQAASALGLPLHSVKFHLDQLVDRGLLDVEFRRLSGRTGPGAGRTAKVYRRTGREISVSLPERRYDVAGRILATALERCAQDAVPVGRAVQEAAHAEGRSMATRGDPDAAAPPAPTGTATFSVAPDADLERLAGVLARYGYEPSVGEHELSLANCPFDQMASEHTELVCDMNLAVVAGVLDGLAISALTPRLCPRPGACCVCVAR